MATTPEPVGRTGGPLGRLRARSGLTQEQLAERAAVSVRGISEIERGGVVRPRRHTLEALAEAMKLTADERAAFIEYYRPIGAGLAGAMDAVPAQLPMVVGGLSGRDVELDRLAELIRLGEGSVTVVALDGMAGVGKTALAVSCARRAAELFPDGQMYVNLEGFGPNGPRDPGEILEQLLTGLGISASQLPATMEARAAAFRTRLAGRRVLLVLDNALDPAQVRPLLPAEPGSFVLVTSRSRLAGLVARDGAVRLSVERLGMEEGIDLLGLLAGPGRVAAERDAAARIVESCGGLPIALRVVGERIAAGRTVVQVAEDLDGLDRRLDVVATGDDEYSNLRVLLSWSYAALPSGPARLFRLFGRHDGPDLDEAGLEALAADRVRQDLDVLVGLHLVESAHKDRYQLHDLLRAFARELSDESADAAMSRLADHYLATSGAAMNLAYPHEIHRRPEVSWAGTPSRSFDGPDDATRWLDAEILNLLAVTGWAARNALPDHVRDLSATVARHLSDRGRFAEALRLHQYAIDSARSAADLLAEGAALHGLGNMLWRTARNDDAMSAYVEALAIRRGVHDEAGIAATMSNIGALQWSCGRNDEAREAMERAREQYAALGDTLGEARVLANLGLVAGRQCDYPQAVANHSAAFGILRELGDHAGEARELMNLGEVYRRMGDPRAAVEYQRRAVAIAAGRAPTLETGARIGLGLALGVIAAYAEAEDQLVLALRLARASADRGGEGEALANLGVVRSACGRHDEGVELVRQGHKILHELGQRSLEVEALNKLGQVLCARGDLIESARHHELAARSAEETGDLYELAGAHDGLAKVAVLAGERDAAVTQWNAALEIYRRLAPSQAEEIENHLKTL